MNAELIAVGTEILLGDIVNTDAQLISQGLSELGINVFYQTVVGDNPARLERVVREAKDRADIIITTGGLGPTLDDLTKETSRAAVCPEKTLESVIATAKDYLAPNFAAAKTFKVESKRGDKKFPMTSTEISQHVGGELADLFPDVRPDMHHPDLTVHVEMREKYAFVHAGPVPGAGGMPIGSNGRAALLLSGGIDSPVAGWMMAKRGLELCGIHFFSYPYTSERAKEKVLELGRKLTAWCGRMSVMVVPFTHIQEEIRDKCHEELFTLIMRRFMMRIAERVAVEYGCGALITGESLGQVASQTMPAMAVTGAVCDLPVFRPCIGMDKEEIVTIARKIDTFETSILPYEDCCTVFTPKHPNTKPKMPKILEAESHLDVEALVDEAVKGVEIIHLP